jgi:hypothetical protein
VSDKISVFIVDDSALVRSVLTIILGKISDIEVLGVAANPKLALTKMPPFAGHPKRSSPALITSPATCSTTRE